jgi:hypothetical protein
MGLHLGKSKNLKVVINNKKHQLNIPDILSMIKGVILLDKNGCILKDKNRTYLLEKDGE